MGEGEVERFDPTTVVARLLAGVLSMHLGSDAAILLPVAEGVTVPFAHLVRRQWARRFRVLGRAVEDEVHRQSPEQTSDETAEALANDPALFGLMHRVVAAGARTSSEEKLRWLGSLLGVAVVQRGELDTTVLLVQALDDMEAPHAVVLETMGGARGSHPHREPNAWLVSELVEATRLDEGAVRACALTLVRHGLAVDRRGPFTPESFTLTSAGRTLLETMRSAAAIDASPATEDAERGGADGPS